MGAKFTICDNNSILLLTLASKLNYIYVHNTSVEKNYEKGAEIYTIHKLHHSGTGKQNCMHSSAISLKYIVFHLGKTVRKELVHGEESTLAMPSNK